MAEFQGLRPKTQAKVRILRQFKRVIEAYKNSDDSVAAWNDFVANQDVGNKPINKYMEQYTAKLDPISNLEEQKKVMIDGMLTVIALDWSKGEHKELLTQAIKDQLKESLEDKVLIGIINAFEPNVADNIKVKNFNTISDYIKDKVERRVSLYRNMTKGAKEQKTLYNDTNERVEGLQEKVKTGLKNLEHLNSRTGKNLTETVATLENFQKEFKKYKPKSHKNLFKDQQTSINPRINFIESLRPDGSVDFPKYMHKVFETIANNNNLEIIDNRIILDEHGSSVFLGEDGGIKVELTKEALNQAKDKPIEKFQKMSQKEKGKLGYSNLGLQGDPGFQDNYTVPIEQTPKLDKDLLKILDTQYSLGYENQEYEEARKEILDAAKKTNMTFISNVKDGRLVNELLTKGTSLTRMGEIFSKTPKRVREAVEEQLPAQAGTSANPPKSPIELALEAAEEARLINSGHDVGSSSLHSRDSSVISLDSPETEGVSGHNSPESPRSEVASDIEPQEPAPTFIEWVKEFMPAENRADYSDEDTKSMLQTQGGKEWLNNLIEQSYQDEQEKKQAQEYAQENLAILERESLEQQARKAGEGLRANSASESQSMSPRSRSQSQNSQKGLGL